MAITDEELQMAILKLSGDVAAGRSFKESFSEGQSVIDNLRSGQAKQTKTALELENLALKNAKLREEINPMQNDEVYQEYSPQMAARDKTIHNAYGALDDISFGIGTIGETFGMQPTRFTTARRAAEDLNKDIKIVLTGAFKGRPSNYLLKEIEQLLPTIGNWVGGDAKALERYQQLKFRFDQWIPELDGEVSRATGKTKIDLIKQRAKAVQLGKRLDSVIAGFTEDGTKPNVNAYPDIPVGYELPDTEEGLAEMEDIFMSEIPGEEYKK